MRDRLFSKPVKRQFAFDEEVASVFDDMIARSVPFYKEVQKLVVDLVLKNAPSGGLVYDLGSSTGTLLLEIWAKRKDLRLIGVDNSEAMVRIARRKGGAYGADVEFVQADILEFEYEPADIFLANYTLQFIRPLRRERFVKRIFKALKPGGIFIFSEKVISEDRDLHRQLIDIYHDFKRSRGYSDFEIAQKREALENVLVPYSCQENREMAQRAGFGHVEVIFRWANFATFFAKKRENSG